MREASFTDLRNHAREYFDQVTASEAIRVMSNGNAIQHGKPVLTVVHV